MTTKGKKAWILTDDMGNNHPSLNTFCRKLSEELLTDIFTKVFIDSSTGKMCIRDSHIEFYREHGGTFPHGNHPAFVGNAVSYTHLDVYKRQGRQVNKYVDGSITHGSWEGGYVWADVLLQELGLQDRYCCLLYTSISEQT